MKLLGKKECGMISIKKDLKLLRHGTIGSKIDRINGRKYLNQFLIITCQDFKGMFFQLTHNKLKEETNQLTWDSKRQ